LIGISVCGLTLVKRWLATKNCYEIAYSSGINPKDGVHPSLMEMNQPLDGSAYPRVDLIKLFGVSLLTLFSKLDHFIIANNNCLSAVKRCSLQIRVTTFTPKSFRRSTLGEKLARFALCKKMTNVNKRSNLKLGLALPENPYCEGIGFSTFDLLVQTS
jgi:hypothetical protein